MKKLVLSLLALAVLSGGGLLAYRFASPDKRFEKHIEKARILQRQNDAAGAKREFEAAYAIRGGYRPTVSEEVLNLEVGERVKAKKRGEAAALAGEYLRGADSGNVRVKQMLAALLLEGGDFDSAFALLNGLIAGNPGNLQARGLLAAVRTRQGRPDLAEQQYRQMVKAYPDSASLWFLLAENLGQQGDAAGRRAMLQKALALQPKNPQARLALVDAWLKESKPDSAEQVLIHWAEADTTLGFEIAMRMMAIHSLTGALDSAHADIAPFLDGKPARPEHMAAYFENAVLYARAGKYDSARLVYKAMIPEFPEKADVIARCDALILLVLKKPAEALSVIQTRDPALEQGENLDVALLAYLGLGDETKAREIISRPSADGASKRDYGTVIALAQKDPAFISGLALVNFYVLSRQPFPMLLASQKLYQDFPGNALAVSMLVDQFMAIRRLDLAYQVLAKVRKPSHAQRMIMAQYLMLAKRDKEAVALLEKSIADTAAPGANFLLAEAYSKTGNADRAAEHFEKELALDAGNLAALNNLAWHYGIVKKDQAKAAPYLARLQARAHSDPRILDTIGWILAVNGEGAKGESVLRQAVSIIPDNPIFLYHLAYAQAQTGHKAEARASLEKALASPETWDEKADAAALLKTLI
jgi:predicted Zn-dependent protease